jgi:hypothetical protein
MQVRRRIASLAVAATLAATAATADDAASEGVPGVTVGSRVRIEAPTVLRGGRLLGTVAASDGRSLTLAMDGGLPIVIPREAIERLEVNAGRQHSNVLKSTAIGAIVGVVSGTILPVDPNNCSPQSENLCSRGQAVGQGAATGALLGALVGVLHKTDRWLQVPSGTWRLAVQPSSKGVGGAISVSF